MLETPVICGGIPRMQQRPWMKELKKKKVWLSDVGEGCPERDMMIRQTIIGQLLT